MSKKKKKKNKKGTWNIEEEFVFDFHNECALKLFGKLEAEVTDIADKLRLQEYINDCLHPIWMPVILKGNETIYAVSNSGEVMNIMSGEKLTPVYDKDGYLRVRLFIKKNTTAYCGVHRLVAQAFIPNPENKPTVNHMNCVKQCNWYKNLEWATVRENFDHARSNGLENHVGLMGEANITAKNTEEQVRKVCKMLEVLGNTPKKISEATGVPVPVVTGIRRKKIWTHISKDYNFVGVNYNKGIWNNKNKYTEEQIHQVCKLLEEGKNPKAIEHLTGVPSRVATSIIHDNAWIDIASQYNIDKNIDFVTAENRPQAKYNNKMIEEVCNLLQNPYISMPEIEKKTGVDKNTVNVVYKYKQWKNVSSNYAPFPPRANKNTEEILELHRKGYSDWDIYNTLKDKYYVDINKRNAIARVREILKRNVK